MLVLAGAVMPLAYSPFDYYPLVLLALALLFYVWQRATPGQAFIQGGLFGFGLFAFGVSWVYISMHEYGYVSASLSLLLTLLFVIVLALFPAIAGYVAVKLARAVSADRLKPAALTVVLVFPASWALLEWVRGWFLTGFPWLNIGYSQIDGPLAGLAPVFGVYGVALATAFSAVLIMLLLTRRPGKICGGYLLLFVGLWLVTGLLARLDWTRPAGQPLQVSLVQGNIPQDLKWLPSIREATLSHYTELSRQQPGSDLIVWPETAIPMFSFQAEEFIDELTTEAQAMNSDFLVGLVHQDLESGRYYNTMVGLGSQSGQYHKKHLVPFTEYLPMKTVLAGLINFMQVPMSDFSAGSSRQQPMALAGQKLGISICYEDAFGEEYIAQLPAATLLVNVSNDAWFAGSIAPAQHLQMARMRSLETGRELMRATNTGISAFIAADGRLRDVAPQFESAVLTSQVQPRQGATPYVMWGNGPVLVVVLLMFGMAYRLAGREKNWADG